MIVFKYLLQLIAWLMMLAFWALVWEPLVLPYVSISIGLLILKIWGEK